MCYHSRCLWRNPRLLYMPSHIQTCGLSAHTRQTHWRGAGHAGPGLRPGGHVSRSIFSQNVKYKADCDGDSWLHFKVEGSLFGSPHMRLWYYRYLGPVKLTGPELRDCRAYLGGTWCSQSMVECSKTAGNGKTSNMNNFIQEKNCSSLIFLSFGGNIL